MGVSIYSASAAAECAALDTSDSSPRGSMPLDVENDLPSASLMHAVCIARHRILSDHICSIFREIGVECEPVVGFREGMAAARARFPNVVICDYDLLISAPLGEWERDSLLAEVPIVAVSLTRRPEEAHLVDANGIAGFLYLPTLDDDAIARIVQAVTTRQGVRAPKDALRWSTPTAEPIRPD